jgi:hypothetical protein
MTGARLIAPVVAGILFLLPVIDELRLGRGRRNKQTLRMNEEVIELSGPVALTVPWQDITRIGVRKLGGQAGKTYGVQRQLAPEQKQPEIETQDGWITIWNPRTESQPARRTLQRTPPIRGHPLERMTTSDRTQPRQSLHRGPDSRVSLPGENWILSRVRSPSPPPIA